LGEEGRSRVGGEGKAVGEGGKWEEDWGEVRGVRKGRGEVEGNEGGERDGEWERGSIGVCKNKGASEDVGTGRKGEGENMLWRRVVRRKETVERGGVGEWSMGRRGGGGKNWGGGEDGEGEGKEKGGGVGGDGGREKEVERMGEGGKEGEWRREERIGGMRKGEVGVGGEGGGGGGEKGRGGKRGVVWGGGKDRRGEMEVCYGERREKGGEGGVGG